MAGLLADLNVAGKLALKAVGRRFRSEIECAPDLAQFAGAMEKVVSRAPVSVVRDYCWVDLPAEQPPWVEAKLRLEEGDEVSYFAEGRVYANRFLDIYLNPALQVWCKVGPEGEVFRGTRAGHSFRADHGGELMFGNYFPNDWADPLGARKQNDEVYREVSGEIRILVIRWAENALAGLRALRDIDDPDQRLAGEIARIEQGDTTPPGWHYLWHLGPAEIYHQHRDSTAGDCIHCSTHADVGILQKDVDLPLLESSEISWRWCVDRLPSTLREDTVPSHDYLSVAIEFDNGRDITYYWSSNLPAGTGYDCPLPNWAGKEYHVVVRTGTEGLGRWQNENRNLYHDYCKYMGKPPGRIVRVWLIANSIFQRGEGVCDYADIRLGSGQETVQVL